MIAKQMVLHTRQALNNLETVGQGHPPSNLSENFPRCTYILNMKVVKQLVHELLRKEVTEGRTDIQTDRQDKNNMSPLEGGDIIRCVPKDLAASRMWDTHQTTPMHIMNVQCEYKGSVIMRDLVMACRRLGGRRTDAPISMSP